MHSKSCRNSWTHVKSYPSNKMTNTFCSSMEWFADFQDFSPPNCSDLGKSYDEHFSFGLSGKHIFCSRITKGKRTSLREPDWLTGDGEAWCDNLIGDWIIIILPHLMQETDKVSIIFQKLICSFALSLSSSILLLILFFLKSAECWQNFQYHGCIDGRHKYLLQQRASEISAD